MISKDSDTIKTESANVKGYTDNEVLNPQSKPSQPRAPSYFRAVWEEKIKVEFQGN